MSSSKKTESESQTMTRLREPIGELVEKYCADKTPWQKVRLRQLAWQAVDVLARTENVAGIKNEKDIKRIIGDIRKLGASKDFVEESLVLAISIYRQMQAYHPNLLKNYRRR